MTQAQPKGGNECVSSAFDAIAGEIAAADGAPLEMIDALGIVAPTPAAKGPEETSEEGVLTCQERTRIACHAT